MSGLRPLLGTLVGGEDGVAGGEDVVAGGGRAAHIPPGPVADPAAAAALRSALAEALPPGARGRVPPRAGAGSPCVSVVIPTYRRPELLDRCLRSVLAQRSPGGDWEVLVVDDAGDDATRAQVEGLAAARRPPAAPAGAGAPALRYLRPARGRGPAVARNTGWRAARAPVIAFTDDDTVPAADWLAQGVAAMQPPFVALAGRVEVPVQGVPTDHARMTQGLAQAEFVTANAFVRRDALAAVGGFDERYARAWREDSDLQFRLMALGPVGRVPAARVEHPVRPERWGVSLRNQRNVLYDALLYREHPRHYRERIRRVPPWNFYAIVMATLAAVALVLAGAPAPWAAVCAVAAMAGILAFAAQRLRGTSHAPGHVAEMLVTSALIPYLSVYWRLRGAWRWRTGFL